MNDRQHFNATMHYQPRDRSPLQDFNFWDETIPDWHAQGLTKRCNRGNSREFFGLDCSLGGGELPGWTANLNIDLKPAFESRILRDDGDEYTQMQSDGVIVRRQKSSVSIPVHVGHPDFPLTAPGGRTERPSHNLDGYTECLKAQTAELVTNYGPLLTLWYDMPHRSDAVRGQGVIDFAQYRQLPRHDGTKQCRSLHEMAI